MKQRQRHWGQGGVGVDAKWGCLMSPNSPPQRVPLRARSPRGSLQVHRPGVQLMLSGLVCVVVKGWKQMSAPAPGRRRKIKLHLFKEGDQRKCGHLLKIRTVAFPKSR